MITVFSLCLGPSIASAELELSFYGGVQSAPDSIVDISGDSFIPDANFNQSWQGESFIYPIYSGFRMTSWRDANFGWGLDYTHNKTNPLNEDLPAGFSNLEFTDGLNTWTINAYYRWPDAFGGFTPYVGAGAGLSRPGVEVRYQGSDTFNYQITGVAANWLAGVSYPVDDHWAYFGEYKGSYTTNDVRLTGGGSLKTNIFTDAFNFGFSYRF
jgi:lipid A oxidase